MKYIARDYGNGITGTGTSSSAAGTQGQLKTSLVDAILFVIKNYASPDTIMAFLGLNQQTAYLLYMVLIYVIKQKLEQRAV